MKRTKEMKFKQTFNERLKTILRTFTTTLIILLTLSLVPDLQLSNINSNFYNYDNPFVLTAEAATVKLNKKSLTLIKGKTYQLKISGTKSKVTWKSSKPSVAKVSTKGKVTAVKAGTAKITATVNKKNYTCTVKVESPKLNRTSATLIPNQKVQLKLSGTSQKITWKSDDKTVATVNSKGMVTGKDEGEAYITATVGGKKYDCYVVVYMPYLDTDSLDLEVGDTYTLEVFDSNKQSVSWSSLNKSIATVNSKGKVTAVKAGETKIVATIKETKLSCSVTVYPKETESTPEPEPEQKPTEPETEAKPEPTPQPQPQPQPEPEPTPQPTLTPREKLRNYILNNYDFIDVNDDPCIQIKTVQQGVDIDLEISYSIPDKEFIIFGFYNVDGTYLSMYLNIPFDSYNVYANMSYTYGTAEYNATTRFNMKTYYTDLNLSFTLTDYKGYGYAAFSNSLCNKTLSLTLNISDLYIVRLIGITLRDIGFLLM